MIQIAILKFGFTGRAPLWVVLAFLTGFGLVNDLKPSALGSKVAMVEVVWIGISI